MWWRVRAGRPAGYESEDTTHFTVVDAEGNAVANTYTLNNSYGSAATAKGTGILLNDEMDDFAAKPGTPNMYGLIQGERNAVAPKKRPLSAMTPTIVLRKDGVKGFHVLPRRWVVERTFAWLYRNRHLCKDYERQAESEEAFCYFATTLLMLRRLRPAKAVS